MKNVCFTITTVHDYGVKSVSLEVQAPMISVFRVQKEKHPLNCLTIVTLAVSIRNAFQSPASPWSPTSHV